MIVSLHRLKIQLPSKASHKKPMRLLDLAAELEHELKQVHHGSLSSTKYVNSKERYLRSDTNTGERSSREISCRKRSIEHREKLKTSEIGSEVQEQTWIFSVSRDRTFHTVLSSIFFFKAQILLLNVDNTRIH